jgi:hypothetical protein
MPLTNNRSLRDDSKSHKITRHKKSVFSKSSSFKNANAESGENAQRFMRKKVKGESFGKSFFCRRHLLKIQKSEVGKHLEESFSSVDAAIGGRNTFDRGIPARALEETRYSLQRTLWN